MAGQLDGRVIIVTGGARGIGAALVARCAEEGAKTIIADILEDEAAATANAVRARGGEAIAVATDIADRSSVDRLVAEAMSAFGRVDGLVNNAALIAGLARRPFDEIPESEWDRVMAINVRGAWNCCAAVAPAFRRQGYGKIVNIASDTILSGVPGLLHYVASKGAVFAMTRSLARELGAANVTVNAIAPGFTETAAALEHGNEAAVRSVQGRAIQRPQRPEDLAGAVVFLMSADSDFMTGQLLTVNGGYIFH
jgi:NAD(P)-dependent dehydrogenase (short-subunit alcohol dehydrogenase family)